MYRISKLLIAALLVSFVAFVAACGEDPEENGNDNQQNNHNQHENHNHGEAQVEGLELIDRSDDSVIAYIHGDHWHSSPLILEEDGDHLSLGFRFLDGDDEEVHLHLGDDDEVTIHAHDDGIVDIDHHGDHIHLHGVGEGETELHIELLRDGEVVYTAPDLNVLVVHDDHDHDDELEVDEFIILDRAHSPHEPIADVHDGHWDGDFADGIALSITDEDIVPGSSDWYERGAAGTEPQAVSLGVQAFEIHDDHSHEISIPGSYRLEAVHAHSEDEDVLYISESHGDHVHFVGIGEGHAHVIFQLVDQSNDEVVYESPEFEFDVHGHDD